MDYRTTCYSDFVEFSDSWNSFFEIIDPIQDKGMEISFLNRDGRVALPTWPECKITDHGSNPKWSEWRIRPMVSVTK